MGLESLSMFLRPPLGSRAFVADADLGTGEAVGRFVVPRDVESRSASLLLSSPQQADTRIAVAGGGVEWVRLKFAAARPECVDGPGLPAARHRD